MLVVIMQFLPGNDSTDFFIFTEPTFDSYTECTLFIREPENAQKIGVKLIEQFGFPIVAMVGLGYFVYYVWRTIINIINPAIKEMHFTLIKLIDQIRMLDQDMIRMQQKVNTVLQMKENEKKKKQTK